MVIVKKRRGRPSRIPQPIPQRKMKYVHVDAHTMIQVPADIPDEDAIERFNLKRRVGPRAKGMALIALKEAEEAEELMEAIDIPPEEAIEAEEEE